MRTKADMGGGGVLPYADVRMVRLLNELVADDCGTADCQMTHKQTHGFCHACRSQLV